MALAQKKVQANAMTGKSKQFAIVIQKYVSMTHGKF
jgi:hypothetical protein